MADGRHFENRKYAITRPRIVRSSDLHQILDINVEIGANLNFLINNFLAKI